jgi:hypothetical protein
MDQKEQFKKVIKLMVIDKGLPESWAERVNLDSDKSVDEQLAILEKEFHAIKNKGKNEERSEEEWLKLMNEHGNSNVGKEDLKIVDYSKTV